MPQPRAEHFSTPWMDDPNFDVNSTPSRHLSTDPRMAGQFTGSLFAITPLVGRSRNISGPLIPGDTPVASRHGRTVSGVPPFALSDGVVNRHEFLQGLTADRRAPHTEGPEHRRTLLAPPHSPSPYTSLGHGRNPSVNRYSHMRSGSLRGALSDELEVELATVEEKE